MKPVVNGLEEDFKAKVEFWWIDANSVDGQALFQSFNLRAHPSYVLINPNGDVLWLGLGEQPQDILTEQLHLAIGE